MSETAASIMLVDDHPLLRKGLRQLLTLSGEMEVVAEASNGKDAIKLASELDPDLILLDLNMQGMDGHQTLKQLRDDGVTSRIVMLTVSDSNEDVIKAISLGADGYLLKDSDPDELLEQIKKAVQGKMVLSEAVNAALAEAILRPVEKPSTDLSQLTHREQEILELIAKGRSNKLIARELNISDGTVKVHVKHLLKKLHLRSIIHELLWFLQGDTNIKYLKDNGVRIWDEWADENGDLGPVYGYQWRSWPAPNGESIDQISKLIEMIKKNPDSRRLIVSAWNPALVEQMALPPCHALFQFYVADGKLSCQLYQRSADIFLGVPFNIASYALLTLMVAQVCGLQPGDFIWTGGDCHLYANHIEQTDLQLSREPLPLPVMKLNPEVKDLLAFKFEDFELVGYQAHPHIPAPVAV